MALSIALLLPFTFLPLALADTALDASRLGSFYTAIPLYRGAATNVFVVGIGTPSQEVNLTVSTNVEFVMVASVDCIGCTENAFEYSGGDSSSFTASQQALSFTSIYPGGSLDTIRLTGDSATEVLTDPRQDTENSRPVTLVSSVEEDAGASNGGSDATLAVGTSGFWGLGVYQTNKAQSIIPSTLAVNGQGAPSSAPNLTVGFDIANRSSFVGNQAGTVHWAGAPSDAYQGSFNWLNTNTTVAGSWGIPVDRIRVGNAVVDTTASYGSLDPGFDAIYVPSRIAEALFAAVPGASRDLVETTRWNIPCNSNVTMSVTIAKYQYNVATSELVQPRDRAGQTCWGSIVAWQNGSTADSLGEIRLGTPFMSGVYSVLFYSDAEQLVGIAGKPNSVNALDVNSTNGPGQANGQLAGGLIGGLLTFFVILFAICYGRNRSRFQSVWYRALRRQHRFQVNAMIRGASIPPVVPMPMPMPVPPMMGQGMMPGYMPGAGVGNYGQMMPPPPYGQGAMPQPRPASQQGSVRQQRPGQYQQSLLRHQEQPAGSRRLGQSPTGFHSSRQQIISPRSAPQAPPPFPAMFQNPQYHSPRQHSRRHSDGHGSHMQPFPPLEHRRFTQPSHQHGFPSQGRSPAAQPFPANPADQYRQMPHQLQPPHPGLRPPTQPLQVPGSQRGMPPNQPPQPAGGQALDPRQAGVSGPEQQAIIMQYRQANQSHGQFPSGMGTRGGPLRTGPMEGGSGLGQLFRRNREDQAHMMDGGDLRLRGEGFEGNTFLRSFFGRRGQGEGQAGPEMGRGHDGSGGGRHWYRE